MDNIYNIKTYFKDEDIINGINKNGFYVCEKKLLPSNYEYKHLSMKEKFLIDHNLEYISFNSKLSIIGLFNNFINLPYISEVKNIVFEYSSFTTLSPLEIRTKNNSLLISYYSGIINDFIGENVSLTFAGELPPENYNFFILSNNNSRKRISLRNFSSYIDGVFESENKVVLIISELFKTEDTSLKDLFVPYLYFKSRTSKDIVLVYMSFSNDIFRLYQLNFADSEVMNSGDIVKFMAYKLSNDKIVFTDIIEVINRIEIIEEPEVPFPQANDFDKIIDLIHLLSNSEFTFDEITENYGFVGRQTKYYTDAGIYLNLIKIEHKNQRKVFTLSERGKEIVSSKIKYKYIKLIECILEHEVFNRVLKLHLESSVIPNNSEIVKIMKESNIYNVKSESTFFRRASTVQSWLKWIINLPKVYY